MRNSPAKHGCQAQGVPAAAARGSQPGSLIHIPAFSDTDGASLILPALPRLRPSSGNSRSCSLPPGPHVSLSEALCFTGEPLQILLAHPQQPGSRRWRSGVQRHPSLAWQPAPEHSTSHNLPFPACEQLPLALCGESPSCHSCSFQGVVKISPTRGICASLWGFMGCRLACSCTDTSQRLGLAQWHWPASS